MRDQGLKRLRKQLILSGDMIGLRELTSLANSKRNPAEVKLEQEQNNS